jgi:hypothetical protein
VPQASSPAPSEPPPSHHRPRPRTGWAFPEYENSACAIGLAPFGPPWGSIYAIILVAVGISALILFDCFFSSRGGPDPPAQPLCELRQADGAHPHQPPVERPEPLVGPMPHVLGSGRERLQVGRAVQAHPELAAHSRQKSGPDWRSSSRDVPHCRISIRDNVGLGSKFPVTFPSVAGSEADVVQSSDGARVPKATYSSASRSGQN